MLFGLVESKVIGVCRFSAPLTAGLLDADAGFHESAMLVCDIIKVSFQTVLHH